MRDKWRDRGQKVFFLDQKTYSGSILFSMYDKNRKERGRKERGSKGDRNEGRTEGGREGRKGGRKEGISFNHIDIFTYSYCTYKHIYIYIHRYL